MGQIARVRDVDLVEGDQPGAVGQFPVGRQFPLDDVDVGDRVASRLHGRAVDDVHERAAPFDVTQELVT